MDYWVQRYNLFYKKFTNFPFTGEISRIENGGFKKGNKDGKWLVFHENAQLRNKSKYKDGKQDGIWEWFREDGTLEKTKTWKMVSWQINPQNPF